MLPHMGPYILSCIAPGLNGCARIALAGALRNLGFVTVVLELSYSGDFEAIGKVPLQNAAQPYKIDEHI